MELQLVLPMQDINVSFKKLRSRVKSSKGLRIALLTAAQSWSGVEVHTINLAKALKKAGHDVFIVELGRRGYVETPLPLPCPVVYQGLGPDRPDGTSLDTLGFMDWRRIFGNLHADIAISIKGVFKFSSLAMEAAARFYFKRFHVIEHLHAPLGKRPHGNPLKLQFGIWWYRQRFSGYLRSVFPNKVVCVSHALAATLKEDYGYPTSKLFVAHSGVDTDVFVPDLALRQQARKEWGIPDSGFVFGTVGRLSPMKNHEQLVEAFAKLYDQNAKPDIYLVIVGEGPLHNSLETLARSRGVQERIVLFGFTDTPQKICPGFDMFCFPSTSGESLGIALLEAMSCGCPAIAAATGGVPEILNDNRFGWLIPPGDESALLAAMKLALDQDRGELQKMGRDAREHVVKNFNGATRWDDLSRFIATTCILS